MASLFIAPLDLLALGLDAQAVQGLRDAILEKLSREEPESERVALTLADIAEGWGSVNQFNGWLETRFGLKVDFSGSVNALWSRISHPAMEYRSVICATCFRENRIKLKDQTYRYCIYDGHALQGGVESVGSQFQSHPDADIFFLALSGYHEEDAEAMARTLEHLDETLRRLALIFHGRVKSMGGKYLVTVENGTLLPTLAIIQMFSAYLKHWNQEQKKSIQMRVGLHHGDFLGGIMGVTGNKYYDVIGKEINRAARILGEATGGETNREHAVVVSEVVYQALREKGFANLDLLASKELKGFEDEGQQNLYRLRLDDESDFAQVQAVLTQKMVAAVSCDHPHNAGGDYCPACGNDMRTEVDAQAEFRNIYILSIDVVGFSRKATELEPQALSRWINDFYHLAEPVVTRHHGVIIGRNGDELLVRFGYPSVGNNALQAVLTAVDLKAVFARYNQNPTSYPLHFRIGVAEGRGLVRGEKTWADVVQVAQDTQARASKDDLLVDAATREILQDYFLWEERGEDFRVLEAKTRVIELALGSGLIPLVGRAPQLLALAQAFTQAGRQGVQTRLLMGVAGSGRASVLTSFLADKTNYVHLLSGRLTQWQKDPLRALLRETYDGFLEQDSAQFLEPLANFEFDTASSGRMQDPRAVTYFLLGRFIGVPLGNKNVQAEVATWDIRFIAQCLLQILIHYFRKLSAEQVLVLTVDQMEFAETGALLFLRKVLEGVQEAPILFLLHATPTLQQDSEQFSIFGDFPHFDVIPFPPLGLDDVKDFCVKVLDDWRRDQGHLVSESASVPGHLIDDLFRLTGGHPQYLLELIKNYLVREWIEWNVNLGIWLYHEGHAESIPKSLDDALMERIDRLPERDKLLFQTLSVQANHGGVFWTEALEALLTELGFVNTTELYHSLAWFDQLGLIRGKQVSSLPRQTEYRLTPERLGELVYLSLTKPRRQEAHRALLVFLQKSVLPQALDQHDVWALASHHAWQAHDYEPAFRFMKQAIRIDEEIFDASHVLAYVERARIILDLWGPDNHEALNYELLMFQLNFFGKQPEPSSWKSALDELDQLVQRNPREVAWKMEAISRRIDYMVKTGIIDDDWLSATRKNIGRDQAILPAEGLANFFYQVGKLYSDTDRYVEAMAAFKSAQKYGQQATSPILQGQALLGLANVQNRQHKYSSSIWYARQAIVFFAQINAEIQVAYCYVTLGNSLEELGRYEEAISNFKLAYALAEKRGDQIGSSFALLNLAAVYAYVQQFSEALDTITALETKLNQVRVPKLRLYAFLTKAMIVSREDPSAGVEAAKVALEIHGYPSSEAAAHFALALAYYRQGHLDATAESLTRALLMRESLETKQLEIYERELLFFVSCVRESLPAGDELKSLMERVPGVDTKKVPALVSDLDKANASEAPTSLGHVGPSGKRPGPGYAQITREIRRYSQKSIPLSGSLPSSFAKALEERGLRKPVFAISFPREGGDPGFVGAKNFLPLQSPLSRGRLHGRVFRGVLNRLVPKVFHR